MRDNMETKFDQYNDISFYYTVIMITAHYQQQGQDSPRYLDIHKFANKKLPKTTFNKAISMSLYLWNKKSTTKRFLNTSK